MSFVQPATDSSPRLGPRRGDCFVAQDGQDAGTQYEVLTVSPFGETVHVTLTQSRKGKGPE